MARNLAKFASKIAGKGLALRAGYATGAAAGNNLTVTAATGLGIKVGDEILFVMVQDNTSKQLSAIVDPADATIVSADTLKFTAANTTSKQVWVVWASIK